MQLYVDDRATISTAIQYSFTVQFVLQPQLQSLESSFQYHPLGCTEQIFESVHTQSISGCKHIYMNSFAQRNRMCQRVLKYTIVCKAKALQQSTKQPGIHDTHLDVFTQRSYSRLDVLRNSNASVLDEGLL